jgi:hypothetical protein
MADSLSELIAKVRRASPNSRIDYRDEIARHGADAVEALGEWLADPVLCGFAVRVIGKAADLGARQSAVTKLQAARGQTTPVQRADIDAELKRLGEVPGKASSRRRSSVRRTRHVTPLKEILYELARNADPERRGIDSHTLYQRMAGTAAVAGRDMQSVYDAMKDGQDLFKKMPSEPNTFVWLEMPRTVYQPADGALAGRRLAIVAHGLARSLDPDAGGLHYYKYIGAVLGAGERITGANPGATVHSAVNGAKDLFEQIGAGEYRWLRVPMVEAAGWMMRTNREMADWLFTEVNAGRLHQGWGSNPDRDLRLLRAKRERGEPFDDDDELAWDNRRMLPDEPDGMRVGDLVLTPHLPREWRWSVLRIVGPYRYAVHEELRDYGHILPVEMVEADINPDDVFVTDALREAARYPARLLRMSAEQTADLHRLVGD